MASGNTGLIQPYMFDTETDSEVEKLIIQGLQVAVSEWHCVLCISLQNVGHITVI